MNERGSGHPALIEALGALAESTVGFARQAQRAEALGRLADQLVEENGLLGASQKVRDPSPALLEQIGEALTIGETYFFRQPEHFQLVADELVPRWRAEGRSRLSAWSAGCSSGEEAYSLAAFLREQMPDAQIDVLGTDLDARRLERARIGAFGSWSLREDQAVRVPMLDRIGPERWQVRAEIQALCRFERHNLLDSAPGRFDLVFCRNVLIYLSEAAIRSACAHLSAALRPAGVLVLGSVEVQAPPPGLSSFGQRHLQAFARPMAPLPPRVEAKASVVSRPGRLKPTARDIPSTIVLHFEALRLIERGDLRLAAERLDSLCRQHPRYLPGLLERALLHDRVGERRSASRLMERISQLAQQMPLGAVVDGPESLPTHYYLSSSAAYLSVGRIAR